MTRELINYDDLLKKAIEIATKAHEGQVDKGGNPYILHPLSVMAKVKSKKGKIVAVLHDVIEDTPITRDDLLKDGFPLEIADTVQLLSKDKKMDYMKYIKIIKKNELAKEVKLEDLGVNMDLSRLTEITLADLHRNSRYEKAHKFLNE